jgi:ATP-dependent DNA helicase RecG
MSNNKLSSEGKLRLNAMVNSNDGFEIANVDLNLRGPGDLQGTQQSGTLDFKMADISKDEKLVVFTRNLAINLLKQDPELQLPEHTRIKNYLSTLLKTNNIWGKIS